MPTLPTPKDRFTSLDTLAVVRELRALGAARADKAFDLPHGGWSLVLHVAGAGRHDLELVPGRYAALLGTPSGHTEELSPMAKELRRLLAGAIFRSVVEPGSERSLELSFSKGDDGGELLLVLELFGAGNLTVVRGGRVVAVAHPRAWAHRSLKVGATYARPPARPDPWKLQRAEIEAELGRSRTDLASTLAARLALGGPVAEEAIVRAGVEGDRPASADAEATARSLHDALGTLLREVGDRPRGYLCRQEGLLVDVAPYRPRRWPAEVTVEERATFSEAAHEYFQALAPAPVSAEARLAAEEAEALARLEERQREAIADLDRRERELREEADTILSEYAAAEEALREAAPAEGATELTVRLGGRPVTLTIGVSPRRSAQRLYAAAKELAQKLEGARDALTETVARRARPGPAVRPGPAPASAAPSRRFWFEKYRWFLTSEGAIVLAGRDAASNDLLVRRNLKSGDLYFHADLHGASSVVVKRPAGGLPLGEATRREAAQWAVAFSKAWRAGLASASAFWVEPEQVSKAAASGEFVPKGAWVIHGTKHFVRDLPLELALGTIHYESAERWTVAPESAVRAHGRVLAFLTPGEERDRSNREVELSRDLGVPRPLLQSLLPAGGLSVRRP
jgi:predicted ribosome quality control (RQC) complex YloA/Tae2 family protein